MDNAKKIFFQYNGNELWMCHDRSYDAYKSYCVSKEQEDIWHEELLLKHLCDLENSDYPKILFRLIEEVSDRTKNYIYMDKALEILKRRNEVLCNTVG